MGYRIATAVLIAVLIIGAFWRIVLTDEYTWLDSPDLAFQVMPWFQVQAGEWHAGRVPLWDPYTWAGQPLLGQAQPGAAYPLNWLLFWMPLANGWIRQALMHWYLVALHLIAAAGLYRLARELGCARLASVAGALIYSLTGWLAQNEWPQMVNGAIWAPFVLRFLVRVERGDRPVRNATLAGFFLGLSWLSGHHQIPIYLSLVCAGLWLWRLFRAPLAAAAFWAVTLATGALQILPAREYGLHALRWVGLSEPVGWDTKVAYWVHQQYSLQPFSLIGIVLPGVYAPTDLFMGITALTLALLGLALAWKRSETRLFSAVALFGLLLALGSRTPFHGILYALLPVMDKARTPAFAILLFGLGAAVLAALGADAAMRADGERWLRRAVWLTAGAGLGLFLIRGALVLSKPFSPDFDSRHLMVALVALLLSGILAWRLRGTLSGMGTGLALAGLILMEANLSLGYAWPSRYDASRPSRLVGMAAHGDVVQFLRRQPGAFRVDVDDKEIPVNFGDWHGVQQLGGYLASVTKNVYELQVFNAGARRLLGVEYSIRKAPTEFFQEEVFSGEGGMKVFRNRTVFPRAFAVHKAEQIPNPGEAWRWLDNPSRDWRQSVFLASPPPALSECGNQDLVQVALYTPNRVTVQADLGCRGMVILTDTYFPGWRAYVDGKPAPMWEAYTAVRGVVVEGGHHTVEFRYESATIRWGAGLTLVGMLSALLAWLLPKRGFNRVLKFARGDR